MGVLLYKQLMAELQRIAKQELRKATSDWDPCKDSVSITEESAPRLFKVHPPPPASSA